MGALRRIKRMDYDVLNKRVKLDRIEKVGVAVAALTRWLGAGI
jgi:hypothetical protein